MVKTNKKTLLMTMLVVFFSAMLLVGGLLLGSKPQVDAKVKAETSTIMKGDYWAQNLTYDIINLTITTDDSKKPTTFLEKHDVSLAQDNSLHAYVINGANNTYDCIVYGDVDTIYAPEDAEFMFSCDNQRLGSIESVNLTEMDFSNCKSMRNLFYLNRKLKTVVFSDLIDTSNVKDMYSMFGLNESLEYLDLSNFNTTNVENMSDMFVNCVSLKKLTLSSKFVTNKVTNFSGMFSALTFSVVADIFGVNKDSETFYTDLYLKIDGQEFVGQDGDDTNDEQEAKELLQQEAGIVDKCSLKTLDISGFTISSTATTEGMFMGLEPDIIITPKDCAQSVALPTTMYKEGTAEEVSVLPSTSMVLVKDANASASDYEADNGTTPATGFDTTDLIITTTLGMSLLVLVAIAFVCTKKKNKRLI